MANEFGYLIDSRNGQKPAETHANGSQPKGALLLTPGCMRGIGDVGAFCALHEVGIAQQFHGYFGVSVGAVEILFADEPTRGLSIFSKLTGHNFVKLSQQGLSVPYFNRMLFSAETIRQFQVVGQAATSLVAQITGYDGMRIGAHLDNQYLSKILHEEIIPDFEKIKASEKEYRVYYTNARTGKPQSYDLRDTQTLDEALLHVDASSRLPFISGRPINIGNELLFDGCYSASYPTHDIVDRGYTHIVMMLSLHPDDVLTSENEIGRLVDLYARLHARSSMEAYADYRARLPDILEEIMTGQITTENGTAHIRIIHPEKAETKMNPLETRPEVLEEQFWLGYGRGKMFVTTLEREHKQDTKYADKLNAALGFNIPSIGPVKRLAHG